MLRIHECCHFNIRNRLQQHYILFSTTKTITITLCFITYIRGNKSVITTTIKNILYVVINFWKTVSHDNFIQFQHLWAELLSKFSEENSRCVGTRKLNQYSCNSQSTAKQTIHCRTYDRILIGFINYDRIIVIKTAVTLLLYLNLCAYLIQCLSATPHKYLINLQRYNNRSQRLVPQKNISSTYLTHLTHSGPTWAIPTPLGPFRPHLGHSDPTWGIQTLSHPY